MSPKSLPNSFTPKSSEVRSPRSHVTMDAKETTIAKNQANGNPTAAPTLTTPDAGKR